MKKKLLLSTKDKKVKGTDDQDDAKPASKMTLNELKKEIKSK